MHGTAGIQPILAIVVPVYKHPVLVNEAIDSALAQNTQLPFIVIAVRDGCPLQETREALAGWRALEPRRVHVITRPNRGLASARNCGASYALKTFPSVQGIFFLDADNRLESGAVEVFAGKLANQ